MKRIGAGFLVLMAAVSVQAQRLPRTVLPSHYDITFQLDFPNDAFLGTETIEISVQQPLSEVVLNAAELEFDEATVESAGRQQSATVSLDAEMETATLRVAEPIAIGPARLRIRYHGLLNKELRGLYLGVSNGRKYAATQLEVSDARRAFPSFDEPEFKATFAISAIAAAQDKVISNGAVVSDRPGPRPGTHTVSFATTPRMSTYLVALVVGDFSCVEGGAAGIPMRVCASSDKFQLGRQALTMSEKFTSFFNDYFDIPHPFGKLDHIGIPDFSAGAMENSGAILYRDIYLLMDEKTGSLASKQGLAGIVSHEIAHMWFGDLVTMRWWDDIWLNEGFATWVTSKPIDAAYPDWDYTRKAVWEMSYPINADSLVNTRPIRVEVKNVKEADELFDAITYEKASSVLGMVESLIGPEAMQRGVSTYLKNHSYSNATSDDFSEALSDAADDPAVSRILDTFVSQAGVPLVTAEVSCENGRTVVQARQKRFFVDPALADRQSKESWTIPLCMRELGSNESTCRMLANRTDSFEIDGCREPLYLNAGGKGYYITASEDEDLAAIRDSFTRLQIGERIALVRDEWMLVRSTQRPVTAYLLLAEKVLKQERNPLVIDQLLTGLAFVDRWLSGSQQAAYRAWMRDQLRPLARELGWRVSANESPERIELRNSVFSTLGFTARDPELLAEARKRAQAYFRNPSSIDPSLVDTTLKLAAVEGDEKLFDQALRALARARTPQDTTRLQTMLSSFRNPRLLQRLLDLSLLPDTRITEARGYVGSVLGSIEGRDLAWEFLRTRWDDVMRKIPGIQASRLVSGSATFCDPARALQVKEFFEEHRVEGSERALARAVESIELCSRTAEIQVPTLTAWLSSRPQTAAR